MCRRWTWERLRLRSALSVIFLRTHIKPHPLGPRRGTRGLLGVSTDPRQLFMGSGRYGRRLSHAVFTSFLEQTWVIHRETGAGTPPNPHPAQIMSQIPGACWGEFDILHGLTDSASCDHWILLRFNALWGNPTRIITSQISKWHNTWSYSGVTSSKGKFYIENCGMVDDDIAITLRWLNHTPYFYKQSGLIPSVLQPQSQPQFSITTAVWSKTCILNQSVNKAICCTHNFVTIHCSNVW